MRKPRKPQIIINDKERVILGLVIKFLNKFRRNVDPVIGCQEIIDTIQHLLDRSKVKEI